MLHRVLNVFGYDDITNIATSAVCPTYVESPMNLTADTCGLFVPDVSNPTREQAEERMKAMHRLDIPYLEASEMSDVTMFFASDAARCINGEALAVSGGPMAMNAG